MRGPDGNNYFGAPPHEFILNKFIMLIKFLDWYKNYIDIYLFRGSLLTRSVPHVRCHTPLALSLVAILRLMFTCINNSRFDFDVLQVNRSRGTHSVE